MATGDLKGNLGKLEQGLRLINYPSDVDYTGLAKGDPSAFLPIINYSFTSFSAYIVELLVELDVELTGKDDLRFIEAVYKLLRDHFQYKPVLTKQQFLQFGFAERKMQTTCDIINLVSKKHKHLSNMDKMRAQARQKLHAIKQELQADSSNLGSVCTDATNFQQVLQENKELKKLKCELNELKDKVNSMHFMEEKLNLLEEKLEGKVIINERDWNNLLSRVRLLETQLLLQPKKIDLPREFNRTEESTSSVHVTPVSPDKEKDELPASLSRCSGSSHPSPQAMGGVDDLSTVSKDSTVQRMERISKMAAETSEYLKTSSNTP